MNQYYPQLIAFYYISQHLSITKAAKLLMCSKAHISKQLSDLERLAGTLLIQRNTRTLTLTMAGEELFKHAQSIVSELREVDRTFDSLQNKAQGVLKITSPQGYANYVLAPHLPQFLMQYPDISLDMIHSGAYLNLIEEKIDIAIRISHEPPLDRVAKLLDYDQMVLCASIKYLEQYGRPKTPDDLLEHPCLVYSSQKNRAHWPFYDNNNLITVAVKPRLSSNSISIILHAVTHGFGIARVPLFTIQNDLDHKKIERVLPNYEPPGTPIYAVFSPGRIISAKVHAFVKFLEQLPKLSTSRSAPSGKEHE